MLDVALRPAINDIATGTHTHIYNQGPQLARRFIESSCRPDNAWPGLIGSESHQYHSSILLQSHVSMKLDGDSIWRPDKECATPNTQTHFSHTTLNDGQAKRYDGSSGVRLPSFRLRMNLQPLFRLVLVSYLLARSWADPSMHTKELPRANSSVQDKNRIESS